MPWTYEQSTGYLYHDGVYEGIGYAGHGAGLNNPAMQGVHDVGPLPVGLYTMEAPFDHPHCGRYSIRLTPDPANDMRGRDGFYIHGDNQALNRSASNGCIVAPIAVRTHVWASGDHELRVIPGPSPRST